MDALNHLIVWENSLVTWLAALLITLLTYAVLRLAQRAILAQLERRMRQAQPVPQATPAGPRIAQRPGLANLERLARQMQADLDHFTQDLLKRSQPWFFLALALYAGSMLLTLPAKVSGALRLLAIIAALLQAASWGSSLIDYLIQRRVRADPATPATAMTFLRTLIKIAMWSLVVLLILENITGIQVDALIASLGVTGIAIALALQSILSDLFASLSIAIDKPFVIGDTITVGEYTGSVEHIGLKSTRLRSVSGEQVVFANSDLLSSRIRNFKYMERRGVVFSLGIAYQTPHDKLALIPKIVQEVIEQQEKTAFDRAFLKEFGNAAIQFECGYFIESPDFKTHTDTQHAVNLALYRCLSKEGIRFAAPSSVAVLEE